ncbi:MAG: hypothetical protein IJP30_03655, partial [Clostridia bacterium]|nr:hypothetical protein [Clostridia bacterium]MBQ9988811.1 hypothetical protein [Clostridia bacterium]
MSFIQCLGLALTYWFRTLSIGYSIRLSDSMFFVGMWIFAGDPVKCAITMAAITPMFLAFTGAGGTVVWD